MTPDATPREPLGLVDALARLSFLVQDVLDDVATAHGVSPAQARLLGILRDHEPTMNQLGGHLGLDKASVSGLVDRAARRGLVERVPSTSDRRVVHVRATDAGRSLADAGGAEVARRLESLAGGLAPADRETLAHLASRVVHDAAGT